MSSDPAGFELINPMGSDGKAREGYSAVESLNWYSYVSNNPLVHIDPTGMGEDDPQYFTSFNDALTEFNEAVSSEITIGLQAEVEVSLGPLITVAGKLDALSQRYYSEDSQQGSKVTQGASLELGVGPMAPLTLEVGREAEGADMGYFIFDPGYRERVSESTTGVTFDADTVSFAAGLGIGGKLDISISESMDFVNKLSGTIGRAIGKLFDD